MVDTVEGTITVAHANRILRKTKQTLDELAARGASEAKRRARTTKGT